MSKPQPAFVSEIQGVFLFARGRGEESFVASSPPGHLLHLVVEGEVRQRCNEREYHLRPGDMLWYHGNELVKGRCLRTPWRFHSVVFEAPFLPPPPFGERLSTPPRKALALFRELHRTWHDTALGDLRRSLGCHAALAQILLLHHPAFPCAGRTDGWLARLWWDVEHRVRQDLGRAYTLEELARLGRVSPATLHRASMAAVGRSPVRHIKRLRLEMARGLLLYSRMTIREIAEKAGYERVNELSRDIRAAFQATPSAIRREAAWQGE